MNSRDNELLLTFEKINTMAKFKITGFSRFFMFLIFAAPLIYSGVALFNGENPLESAKRDLGIETSIDNNNEATSNSGTDRSELALVKNELKQLKDENQDLLDKLKDCQ